MTIRRRTTRLLLGATLLLPLTGLQACEDMGRVEYDSLEVAEGEAKEQLERAVADLEDLSFPRVWEVQGEDSLRAVFEPGRSFGSVTRTYDNARATQFARWWENQGEGRGEAACVEYGEDLTITCDVWTYSTEEPDSRLTATYEEAGRGRGSVTVAVYSQE